MNKFETLGLNDAVVKAVTDMGFESPTLIQEKAIPELLKGDNDLVALAQTGTGKTAAFGLPLASMLDFSSNDTQAVIMCPTRELCMQITRDIQSYTKNIRGAKTVAIYGGASIEQQSRDVKRGAQIVVATPGRMKDMIQRRKVNLSNVRYAVLDEADEMLNMGFKEDLDEILSQTPDDKNTWLFSATMPNEVLRISKNYMKSPVEITAGTKNSGNENIEHVYYVVSGRDKYAALKRLADSNPDIFAIVFCRTRRETQEVAEWLIKDGYNADAIHGDLSQQQRDNVMKRYRNRSLQMLVATDVAARGIDVNNVTHVINYNLPDEIENYTHRSGRTARAGKKGISIVIINNREIGKIRAIERIIKTKFTQGVVPTGFEACEKQLFSLVKKVHNVPVDEEAIGKYMPKIYAEFEDMSKEEVITKFVSSEFNRFLEYYKNARDLNASGAGGRDRDRGEFRPANDGFTKLFVNLGEMDKFSSDDLKTYVSDTAGVSSGDLSQVTVKSSFSFIEVKSELAEKIIGAFKGTEYNNRSVRVEARDAQTSRNRGGGGGDRGRRFSGGGGGGDRRRSSSYGGGRNGGSESRSDRGRSRSYNVTSEGGSGGGGSERKSNFSRDRKPRKRI